jgi:hypothetical protein
MTDRHAGYLITLEGDMRDDDAEATIIALGQIKGVLSVEPLVSDPILHMAEARAKNEIWNRLFEAIK